MSRRLKLLLRYICCCVLRLFGLNSSGSRRLLNDQEHMVDQFSGEKVQVVVSNWADVYPAAISLQSDDVDELFRLSPQMQADILLDIVEPGYSFRDSMIFDRSKRLLTTVAGGWAELPSSSRVLEKPRKQAGCVAFLANDVTNYYHWMCYVLPLMNIYDRHNLRDAIDAFYVGNCDDGGFRTQTLDRLGIRPENRIKTGVTADRLVAGQQLYVGGRDNITVMPKLYQEFVRGLYTECLSTTQFRRIYIARGATARRLVTNEVELIADLKDLGFEVHSMDGMSVAEQARLFSEASVVVAPHGAALTNLIFSSPGCRVVEIYSDSYIKPFFYPLAVNAGAEYAYYIAGTSGTNDDRIERNIDLNPNKFMNVLRKYLATT